MVDTGGGDGHTSSYHPSMADHMNWEHVVHMCRQLHPEEEEEEVAAAGVEAQQLDLEVAAAEAEVAEAKAEVF
jgi:hypothetical protein